MTAISSTKADFGVTGSITSVGREDAAAAPLQDLQGTPRATLSCTDVPEMREPSRPDRTRRFHPDAKSQVYDMWRQPRVDHGKSVACSCVRRGRGARVDPESPPA